MTAPKATGGKLSAERLDWYRNRAVDGSAVQAAELLGHIAAIDARNRKLVEACKGARVDILNDRFNDALGVLETAIEENDDGK